MRRIGEAVVRALPLMLCVTLVLMMLYAAGPFEWRAVGEEAAMLVMGLQHPLESAKAWSEKATVTQTETAPTLPPAAVGEAAVSLSSVIPPKGDGGGAVSEEQIGGGNLVAGAVTVKNVSGVSYDFPSLLAAGMPFTAASSTEPQVLIVHTHATESYMSYYAGYYNDDDVTRSTEAEENMIAVGEVIAQELRAAGVPTIHDATLHDSPAYTGAYTRSAATVASYLQQYPSIRVVLDIHRDAVIREDLTKVKPTVTVDGVKAAQMMLVIGGENSEEYPNPHCSDNLQLALQVHETMEQTAPGIMRPLYLVRDHYNQYLCAGSMLVEMGTDANTLTEALYSGRLLGKTLAGLLRT